MIKKKYIYKQNNKQQLKYLKKFNKIDMLLNII